MTNCNYSFALLLLFFGFLSRGYSQDTTSSIDTAIALPDKVLTSIDKKASSIENKLDQQTQKYLSKLQKQEHKLKHKLLKKDSLLAHELFPNIDDQYSSLQSVPQQLHKYASVYSGHLDSLSTALNFLKSQNSASLINNQEMARSLQHLSQLQGRLNQTDGVKEYLQQRQQLLKESFQKLGMIKELKKYQKQAYYYSAMVQEYKQAFEEPNKLEAKLLEVAMKIPQFRDFFARNSQLGSLFALPGSSSGTAALQGLQTRDMLNDQLAQRFGSGAEVTQMLQQNVQAAQSSLSALKDQVSSFSSGAYGNADGELEIPQFKTNQQKTRSFLQRLEYGGNIQSQEARSVFPVTSDVAATLGYKLSDKSSAGVGLSYRVGWGSGIQNIRITHQGVGLRSYWDLKLKGSIYVTGGYELNYQALISSMEQLKNYSAWQRSGLVGLTKKYSISKKLKGNVQLLWDFLSYQQVPKTQPILWRIGYNLK